MEGEQTKHKDSLNSDAHECAARSRMKHGQLVIGPAGSGKSTYCATIARHCETIKRSVHVVNLDPAVETCDYPLAADIRDLVSLEDVMEAKGLGPNGGLLYCMEYLLENMDWLHDVVNDYADDYLIFDCPGQIELYCHLPVMQTIVKQLQLWGYRLCAVYVMDSVLITDPSRFIAGTLMCLSAMVQMELPHVNVLSKVDLLPNRRMLDDFLDPEVSTLLGLLESQSDPAHRRLNEALASLIEGYNMVAFVPLDITDEDNVDMVLAQIDQCVQYGEDLEPRDPNDEKDGEREEEEQEGGRERDLDDEDRGFDFASARWGGGRGGAGGGGGGGGGEDDGGDYHDRLSSSASAAAAAAAAAGASRTDPVDYENVD